MALPLGSNHDFHGTASIGFMSMALKPDIDRCVERLCPLLQDRGHGASGRNPAEEIGNNVRQVEALWHHLTSRAGEGDNQYLASAVEDLDSRIRALKAELEATKARHRLARAAMLHQLCEQRQRAVGTEMSSSSLMLPAQATAAAAESEASNLMKAAALKAVRLRPEAAKKVAETGSCEEGEIRLSLDNRKLIDLVEFDPSEMCRDAATSTTAAVRARSEANRLIWNEAFEDEKQQIQLKIQQVHEQEKAEQGRHEALVTRLMAKFEAHTKKVEADKARGCAQQGSDDVQGSLRASILGGANASSSSGAPPQSGIGAKSSSRPASRNVNGHPDLERLREISGKPVSEGGKVKQWGSTLVAQLGLNFYPSKPDGWGTRVTKSRSNVPPKVARSMEEASPIQRETDQSLFLSRFLLGSAQSHPGMSCEQNSAQISSAPASTTASTTYPPSIGSTSVVAPHRKIR